MRILFVAMPDSVHTARWINQISGQNWDIHLFPSLDSNGVHATLQNITAYIPIYGKQTEIDPSVHMKGFRFPSPAYSRELAWQTRRLILKIQPDYYVQHLIRLIRRLRPDIIHSLEFQHAGYLTLAAKKVLGAQFPAWMVTNWGSDVYLFGRLANHRDIVRDILASCDYYSCECERDVQIARNMGFKGKVFPVVPIAGGFNLDHIFEPDQNIPPSSRKLILVKGYQHFAGRALFALRALALCADALRGYRVALYGAPPDVMIAAEIISQEIGIPIDIIPSCAHDEMLRFYSRARIYLGLSISDAISTSLLEAMIMGTFPIQSDTSCANEWIQDGVSGLIVPPESPEIVAQALRRALTDDELVDRAAERNALVCADRLAYRKLQAQAIGFYESIIADTHKSVRG